MTKSWWIVGALLALTCCLSSLRADEPDTYNSVQDLEKARKARALSSQNIWWEHLIPGRMEEKRKQAEDAKATLAASKRKSSDDKDAGKKVEVTSRQAELNKALRREAVCQRLREIADETNDPELAKQADLLESRAWAVYEQKVSTASVTKFQQMSEKDVEARLLKTERTIASEEAARADTNGVRSIRGEKKE